MCILLTLYYGSMQKHFYMNSYMDCIIYLSVCVRACLCTYEGMQFCLQLIILYYRLLIVASMGRQTYTQCINWLRKA